jgi:hypothetical protein
VDKINKPADLYAYQEEVWGCPIPGQAKPLEGVIRTGNFSFKVIPAPGQVIIDPGETLDKVIAHLEDLGRRMVELHKQGLNTEEIRTESKNLFRDR